MHLLHNKHGPDFDVGINVSRRPRDETIRNPRDGPLNYRIPSSKWRRRRWEKTGREGPVEGEVRDVGKMFI